MAYNFELPQHDLYGLLELLFLHYRPHQIFMTIQNYKELN